MRKNSLLSISVMAAIYDMPLIKVPKDHNKKPATPVLKKQTHQVIKKNNQGTRERARRLKQIESKKCI